MKRAETTLQRFRKSVRRSAATLGALAVAAVVAAVAIATKLTKAGLANVDVTSKLADRLGIATEQIERFRFAAQIGGVDVAGFDKALERMVRSLGEAAQGLTTPIRGLEAMGLKLEDLQKLKTDEQFLTIAEAISEIQDPLKRAIASYQIFGRQGQKLLNTMMGGRAGIEALGKEADALGLTFDRLAGAQVEAANDAMTRMGAIVKGLSNVLAIELAPMITEVANRLVAWIKESGGLTQIVVPAIEKVISVFGFLADAIVSLRIVFNFMQTSATGSFAVIAKGLEITLRGMNALGLVSQDLVDTVKLLADELGEETLDQFEEMQKLLTDKWPSDKAKAFFKSVRDGAASAAQAALDASKKVAEVFPEELLERLAAGPVEAIKKQIEKVTDDIGGGGGGTRVFRFAASITAGVQDKQLTTLQEILSTLRDENRDRLIIVEAGL